jgi:hypothetical protein
MDDRMWWSISDWKEMFSHIMAVLSSFKYALDIASDMTLYSELEE